MRARWRIRCHVRSFPPLSSVNRRCQSATACASPGPPDRVARSAPARVHGAGGCRSRRSGSLPVDNCGAKSMLRGSRASPPPAGGRRNDLEAARHATGSIRPRSASARLTRPFARDHRVSRSARPAAKPSPKTPISGDWYRILQRPSSTPDTRLVVKKSILPLVGSIARIYQLVVEDGRGLDDASMLIWSASQQSTRVPCRHITPASSVLGHSVLKY